MKIPYELFHVDKKTPVPLYYQLKLCITELIEKQTITEGDILPPESDLCKFLGISRPTVRQCLGELETEGYLSRQKGRGTFVSSPRIDARFLNKLQTFNEEMAEQGLIPFSKMLKLAITAPQPVINEQLRLPKDEPLILIKRIRGANSEPILIQENYLSSVKFPELMNLDFSYHSIYSTLENRYQLYVNRVKRNIRAANATAKDAKLLEIDTNTAICIVTSVAYANQTIPTEYTISKYRSDRIKFSVELCR